MGAATLNAQSPQSKLSNHNHRLGAAVRKIEVRNCLTVYNPNTINTDGVKEKSTISASWVIQFVTTWSILAFIITSLVLFCTFQQFSVIMCCKRPGVGLNNIELPIFVGYFSGESPLHRMSPVTSLNEAAFRRLEYSYLNNRRYVLCGLLTTWFHERQTPETQHR